MGTQPVANKIRKLIRSQKDLLYNILEDSNISGDKKRKSEINQSLKIDDETLKSLEGSQVTIIQNASISNITKNISQSLRLADSIEDCIEYQDLAMEGILVDCFNRGVSWTELKDKIQQLYFDIAMERSESTKQAAERIGVSRTTIIERNKRTRKLLGDDDYIIDI